jgi:hypothetical protein
LGKKQTNWAKGEGLRHNKQAAEKESLGMQALVKEEESTETVYNRRWIDKAKQQDYEQASDERWACGRACVHCMAAMAR